MIRIAVCDDEKDIINTIKQALSDYQSKPTCELEIHDFVCGEDLCESDITFDLIFLDIELNGIDGIKTANLLRQKNKNTRIVYVTSHFEFALKAYSIHPFDFIEKPINSDRIFNVLNEFLLYNNECEQESVIVEFKGISGPLLLDIRDIYVFEYTGNRRITIFTEDKRYEIKGGISEIIELIDTERFTSPHKSFIINMEYVKSLNHCIIYMTNGLEVPVAQKKLKEFKRELSHFITNYIKQE